MHSFSRGRQALGRDLIIILTLFLLTIFGILLQTFFTFQSQKTDAIVIDLAGRQRMLHTKHMKDVLLTSQGFKSDYAYTRKVLDQTLDALIEGGPAVMTLGRTKTIVLPKAATIEIQDKLLEQHTLLEKLIAHADSFLAISPDDPAYEEALHALEDLGDTLQAVSNEAVQLLDRHAESKVMTRILWQVGVALFVGILGVLLSYQLVRTQKEKEREIIERQRAEENLRKSETKTMEALRRSDRLKSSLLSSVSHELRTPLTTVKAMASTGLGSNGQEGSTIPDEVRASMIAEIDYLDRLIDNLLNMSRIEAGMLVPEREWQFFEELLESAIRRVRNWSPHHRIISNLDTSLPPIYVDGVQIQQVLINLLDNAIKFSPEHSQIEILAGYQGNMLEVSVCNEGEGIQPDDLEQVFEEFYRIENKLHRNVRGTGLGLSICKGIIEAHGGSIMAHPVVEGTTRISFLLPLEQDSPNEFPIQQDHHTWSHS